MTESGPATTTARRNQGDSGIRPRRSNVTTWTTPSTREEGPDPHHRLEGDADDVHGRPLGLRHGVEALDDGVRVVGREQRQQPRDLDPCLHLAVDEPAAEVDRRPARRLAQAFEGGQLRRLRPSHLAGDPVAGDDLHRRGDRGDGERDDQRGAHVSAAVARGASARRTRRPAGSRRRGRRRCTCG